MKSAAEVRRVPLVGSAELSAVMATAIEEHTDPALVVTDDNEGIHTHVTRDVIAPLRDLRFVRNEQPGPTEDALLLQPIELRVVVDTERHEPRL
jgi:hypothetical protein